MVMRGAGSLDVGWRLTYDNDDDYWATCRWHTDAVGGGPDVL